MAIRGISPAIKVLTSALWLFMTPVGIAQEVLEAPVAARDIERISDEGFTRMPLRLEQSISSGSAHKGDPIRFTLLRDLVVDGKVVASSGAEFCATVSRVRAKTPERSGSVKFSDPSLVLGNGLRIQLEKDNPEEKAGLASIPFYVVLGATAGPLMLAPAPIWMTEWIIDDIREHRLTAKAHQPRPDPVDQQFSPGDVFVYYADIHSLTRQLRRGNHSRPADGDLRRHKL